MTTHQQNGHRPNSDGHNPNSSHHSSRSGKGTFINSGRKRPCPLCDRTKDSDCSWTQDEGLVMCYELGKEAHPPTTLRGYTFKELKDGTHGPRAHYTKGTGQHRQRSNRSVKAPKGKELTERHIQAAEIANLVQTEVTRLVIKVAQGETTEPEACSEMSAFCTAHGWKEFDHVQLLKKKLKDFAATIAPTATDDDGPRLLKEYRLVEKHFGNRLQFNTLFKRVELDGDPFDPGAAKLEFIVTHNLSLKGSREDIADITTKLAKGNQYSPVVRYLENNLDQHDNTTTILDDLAKRYFKAEEPIYQVMLKRFLIAAVARAFEPGCKHDCALILQGRQGDGKSTFLKTLASPAWFDDSLGATSDKDERLKLHQRWILEWAELENVFKRKDVSQVKAFLTCATDLVRAPYARSSETMDRHSVIAGSTNQSEFLADPTGARRFWVIPVVQRINTQQLQKERDRIWAAATALYMQGEQWYLTDTEAKEAEQIAQRYECQDPWFDRVADYVDCMDAVSNDQIFTHAVQLEVSKFNSGHARRISAIMRTLGWQLSPNPLSHNGKKARLWKLPF